MPHSLLPGWTTIWHDTTASTNLDAQAHLRAGGPAPVLIGSHAQTAGRGRAGRSWQARPGDALLFSCGWRLDLPAVALPPLSLVAGVAACEALGALLGDAAPGRLTLKWPNDLQWQGAKLAGILVESVALPGGQAGVVVGMGLNLHGGAQMSQALGREVADWDTTGVAAAPETLAAGAAQAWHAAIAHYAENGFAPFRARYARWDALAGQPVRVIDNGQVLRTGVARGVDPQGCLLVETDGDLRPVVVGDVSVRAVQEAP